MKRRLRNLALLATFVGGLILFPAWHRAHEAVCADAAGADHGAPVAHNPATCATCQLSSQAWSVPTVGCPSPVTVCRGEFLLLSGVVPCPRSDCALPYSCGPPA